MGLSMDSVKKKIEDAITSAAGLQQLSERTGATASNLSALAAVAKLSATIPKLWLAVFLPETDRLHRILRAQVLGGGVPDDLAELLALHVQCVDVCTDIVFNLVCCFSIK